MVIAKLFERLHDMVEGPETRYIRLKHSVSGGGFPAGSIIKLVNVFEPMPTSLGWLEGSVRCDPPGFDPDGTIDFLQVVADEELLEEAMKPPAPPRRYSRQDVKDRYLLNDDEVNTLMNLEILARRRRSMSGTPKSVVGGF